MIDLLERFKENEIQNKDDLLYSLQSMYDNFDNDASTSELRKEMLQKFIKHIEAMQLPRCDDWWFYSYDFTRFGMVLDMCHCAKYVVESDDEVTMTVDEAFEVTEITCDMMTVAEFAALHHVQPVAVRQWIRRGKLRAIKKQGRFDVLLDGHTGICLSAAECEKLELALLALADIVVCEFYDI